MAKPVKLPVWATDPGAEITEPTLGKKEIGWITSEKPPAGYFNWWQENVHDWIKYFDEGGAAAILQYDTLADLKAVSTGDIVNLSNHYVKEFGIYTYDDSSVLVADGQIVVEPDDSNGRYILISAHPNLIYAVVEEYTSALNDRIGNIDFDNINNTLNVNLEKNQNQSFIPCLVTGVVGSVSTGTSGGEFYGVNSRSSLDFPVAVSSGEALCNLRGFGFDGSNFTSPKVRIGLQASQNWTTTANGTQISFFTTANSTTSLGTAFQISNSKSLATYGNLTVNVNNSYNWGSASFAPSNIYSVNTLNVTSDERLKENISNFQLGLNFLEKMKEKTAVISWKWKDYELDEIWKEEDLEFINPETGEKEIKTERYLERPYLKSNHKRKHAGISAQKTLEVLKDLGVSSEDFPIISIDNYQEGQELEPNNPELGQMTARIELLIPVLINAVCELSNRVKELESFIGDFE